MAEMIEMPKLSDTMTEGTLVKWLKNEGDKISSGDIIAEVETDKATMELEVFETGTLLKKVVAEGDSVPTGAPVAYIGEPGEKIDDAPPAAKETQAAKPEKAPTEARQEAKDATKDEAKPAPTAAPAPAPTASPSATGGRVKSSPLARKLANEKGISLTGIAGSGPGGRIVKKDILAAAEAGGAAAGWGLHPLAPVAEEADLKLSNMRKTIAKRLVQSKQENPHFYVEMEMDAAAMVDLRATLNNEFGASHGIKFSFNDFVMKAAAAAVREVPAVNSSFMGETIRQHGHVQLAFGVALKDGLITPVIREAQNKSLRAISEEANALIVRAKEGKLKPEEYSGGTLTVSNLGGPFGVDRFCAIINPPQAAILAVGNIVKKPVVDEQDRIVVGQRMTVTLSADHRVIDGAVAAAYLKALKHLIEHPALLLL